MNTFNDPDCKDDFLLNKNNHAQDCHGYWVNVMSSASQLCFVRMLLMTLLVLGIQFTEAKAETKPKAVLTLSGPQYAEVGQALEAITLQLVNPGPPLPNARLRIFIHDEADRALTKEAIKIDVKEDDSWREIKIEPIDDGVMGAISSAGKPHDQAHQQGGFAIAAKQSQVWQLRVTFQLPGRYLWVVALSPNNGADHLAQPVQLRMEAL